MRAYLIIVFQVRQQYVTEVPLSEDQHPVRDLAPDSQDEALGEAVRARTPRRDLDHLDTRVPSTVSNEAVN